MALLYRLVGYYTYIANTIFATGKEEGKTIPGRYFPVIFGNVQKPSFGNETIEEWE